MSIYTTTSTAPNHVGGMDAPNSDTTASEPHGTVCMGAGHIAMAMLLCPLIVMVIFGNGLVIFSVLHYQKLQTFGNMLLVSLATADLLVGLLIMPFAFVHLMEDHWRFGQIYCKIWATLDVLLCTASILNLCVISLDRYFAISWPLAYIRKRNFRLAIGLILSVWVLSVIICAPPWFQIPAWTFNPTPYTCHYVKTLSYRIYSACGSFFIPLCVMLTVYFRIFRVSMSREKSLNGGKRGGSRYFKMHRGGACKGTVAMLALNSAAAMTFSGLANTTPDAIKTPRNVVATASMPIQSKMVVIQEDQTTLGFSTGGRRNRNLARNDSIISDSDISDCARTGTPTATRLPSQNSRSHYRKTLSVALMGKVNEYYTNTKPVKLSKEGKVYLKERKALKTIGVVVIGFVACWFPFFVVYILESACQKCDVMQPAYIIFLWLGYSNSVLNPMIYAFYHRDFRRSFRDVLTCGCFKKRTRTTMSIRRLHQSLL